MLRDRDDGAFIEVKELTVVSARRRRLIAILLSVAWFLAALVYYVESHRPSPARAHFYAEATRHMCEKYATGEADKAKFCQDAADQAYASEMRFHAENYEAMLALALLPLLLAWFAAYLARAAARRR